MKLNIWVRKIAKHPLKSRLDFPHSNNPTTESQSPSYNLEIWQNRYRWKDLPRDFQLYQELPLTHPELEVMSI